MFECAEDFSLGFKNVITADNAATAIEANPAITCAVSNCASADAPATLASRTVGKPIQIWKRDQLCAVMKCFFEDNKSASSILWASLMICSFVLETGSSAVACWLAICWERVSEHFDPHINRL